MSAKLVLPREGCSAEDIHDQLQGLEVDPVRGHWSRAFRAPEDVQAIAKEAFTAFMSDNGLMSMRLGWMGKIENELLAMCVSLFNDPGNAAATLTSGGSESIYSAVHAMREWARDVRPYVTAPELVAPYSIHPAFSKACHYFDVKLVRTPLGDDLRGSVEAMEAAITPNTIGLAGSAPCWPYGLFDPIDRFSELAVKHGLWMHTDACVGGYLTPFLERLGQEFPVWDFRAPGVMSISADLHKLGYCPKPASTILWRSRDLLRYHHVHPSDWPGGQYAMTGFAGTRTAGSIFAAWSVMRYLGVEGYLRLARHLLAMKTRLIDGVNAIPGMKAWHNDLLPVAIEATDHDLTAIKAELSALGWILVGVSEPPLINIPLDAATTEIVVDTFIADLEGIVEKARTTGLDRNEALQY